MAISHVIRGEDHLSNTPKHILLFRALGADVPLFAHLPLILNPDRTKMSKRKSQTAMADYVAQGYIREALINHLALLGWSSGTEEEIFSFDELTERFDLDRVQQGGAVFDRERLDWLNGQWIRRLPDDDLVERALPFLAATWTPRSPPVSRCAHRPRTILPHLLPMVRERLPRLDAIGPLVDFLFIDELTVEPSALVPKRWDAPTTLAGLTEARRVIGTVGVSGIDFEAESWKPHSAPCPRSAAGRPVTCSWPSASRSPAGRPRRPCSTPSSRSVSSGRWSVSIAPGTSLSPAQTLTAASGRAADCGCDPPRRT